MRISVLLQEAENLSTSGLISLKGRLKEELAWLLQRLRFMNRFVSWRNDDPERVKKESLLVYARFQKRTLPLLYELLQGVEKYLTAVKGSAASPGMLAELPPMIKEVIGELQEIPASAKEAMHRNLSRLMNSFYGISNILGDEVR